MAWKIAPAKQDPKPSERGKYSLWLRVEQGEEEYLYKVLALDSKDFPRGWDGRALRCWLLVKDEDTAYYVGVGAGGSEWMCSCPAGLKGKLCKHVRCLASATLGPALAAKVLGGEG